jgi:F0F1-type ATP synthase gamma subunit
MAESLQILKTRLKSVKNIGQITKAMELVSATKMRRSQEVALASRPYTLTALDLLATLTHLEGVTLPRSSSAAGQKNRDRGRHVRQRPRGSVQQRRFAHFR